MEQPIPGHSGRASSCKTGSLTLTLSRTGEGTRAVPASLRAIGSLAVGPGLANP